MGHSTATFESLRREKERNNWKAPLIKNETVFEAEILMVHSSTNNKHEKSTKRKICTTLEFGQNEPVPKNYKGTELLIITGAVGKTKVHRIYVDGGSSVNMIYEHCMRKLPEEVKGFV